MGLITLLVVGIVSGQIASLFCGGYSLGIIGNSIAGLTGALFLGKHLAPLFGLSLDAGMFLGGLVGALVILVVFKAGESLFRKKNRLF